ncbi:MAG TPA: methyl-accepting chemotaxis protein, partial [Spirochaetota bacterium]|nr:methyl-accepting chemotaxis protein [Spirochaetota bacterium]
WFKNLRVAYKILISCSVLILMLVAIVFFSISSMYSIQETVKDYRENEVLPIIKMDGIAKNLLQGRINMFAVYVAFTEGNKPEIEKRMDETAKIREENLEILKFIKERSMTETEKDLTTAYEKLHIELGSIMNNYQEALNTGDKVKIASAMNDWLDKYRLVRDALAKLHGESLKIGAEKINNEFARMELIVIYMIIIMIAAVMTGIFITVFLSKSISKPVRKGLEFAQKIAIGDFTERINVNQKDEIGLLSNALNEAADKLEFTITEIISSSNNLAQAVEQIASGNQNLSQRTSEQASALEEVAATIEEANSSINQNYENSLQANRMSETSSGVAVTGGELVGDAVQSINEVNSSAKKIGEITTVINEIAFQTNLLALNAAVEAARAGEQGRGFAVVAGEVRNLAQRAGNAAKEIAQLIHDTVTKVENGTEKTYKSGESLKEIIESVKNVARVVSEIAASSNEQKQGMDQIATAISDLDSMTQHNAALVEETAAASEEMANQAQELIGLMSQFKIRDEKTIQKPSHQQVPSKAVTTVKQAASRGNGKVKVSVPGNDGKTADLEKEGFDMF